MSDISWALPSLAGGGDMATWSWEVIIIVTVGGGGGCGESGGSGDDLEKKSYSVCQWDSFRCVDMSVSH